MIDYSQLVQEVIDGNLDPIEGYAILKENEQFLQKCINEIKDLALDEARKYDQKTFKNYGYKFEFKNGGALYDYSNIEEIKELEDKLKIMKKEAQNRCKTKHQILSEDGEILPKPIVKYRSDSLSIKK